MNRIFADREDLRKMAFVANTMAYEEAVECNNDPIRIIQRVNEGLPALNDIYANIHALFIEKDKEDTEEIREQIKSAYIDMTIFHLLHPLTLRWALTYSMAKNGVDFADLALALMKQSLEAADPDAYSIWQGTEEDYTPELAEMLELYLQMLFLEGVNASEEEEPIREIWQNQN